jgi:hypothetical protein
MSNSDPAKPSAAGTRPPPAPGTLVAKDEPLLDIATYPHLLDLVADLADLPASLCLRATCRKLHDCIERRLFSHIYLDVTKSCDIAYSPYGDYERLPITTITPAPLPTTLRQPNDPENITPGPVPNLNPVVKHAHTVDVKSYLHYAALPALSNGTLVRTASIYPPHPPPEVEVRYLDTRYFVEQLHLNDDDGQKSTVHITFDRHWNRPPRRFFDLCGGVKGTKNNSRLITLVLHPIKGAKATSSAPSRLGLDAFFPWISPRDRPIVTHLTVVGVEECGPELFGTGSSADDVRDEMTKICEKHYPISFLSMDEWAATADPREVEIPETMKKDIESLHRVWLAEARAVWWEALSDNDAYDDEWEKWDELRSCGWDEFRADDW